jgi:hypothetical protein
LRQFLDDFTGARRHDLRTHDLTLTSVDTLDKSVEVLVRDGAVNAIQTPVDYPDIRREALTSLDLRQTALSNPRVCKHGPRDV